MGEKSVIVTKIIYIYREESPTVRCTLFNANLAVTTASFWSNLVQRHVIINYLEVIFDYCFKSCVKH